MKELATALVKAQKAFQPALKTSINPHFRSKYADLAACVDAVMGALNDNGIALIQKCYDCPDGIMVETVFLHESGELLECGVLHFPASKSDPQGYMSALTYGRRGSLMAACGIAPEDDDGNAASNNVVDKYIKTIAETTNSEELQKVYAEAYAACDGNQGCQAKIIAAKKARVEKAKQEKSNG
tara:strand:- start:2193 stop:2741 length:549 start_codon:yes stop_codon:yes gene_type:complete